VGWQVTLLYRWPTPSHYIARLGTSRWCEGWGWSADEALIDLARTVAEMRPSDVPSTA
jgi:hypothetical protein